MTKPVESLALTVATMSAAPAFLSSPDWYTLQGVMAGTALAALVGAGDWKQRIVRLLVSLLLGWMAGQWVAELFGQTSQTGFRFVAGCVAFSGWWIVTAIEKVAPSTTRRAAEVLKNEVVRRAAMVGVGDSNSRRTIPIHPDYLRNKKPDNEGDDGNAG